MTHKYSETELKALDEKFENPQKIVVCPRCGEALVFTSIGNSCEVKCPTENCLYDSIRGL